MNDRCIRFIHWNPDSNAERNFKRPKYIDRDTLYSRTRKLSILKMSIPLYLHSVPSSLPPYHIF